VRRRVLAAPDTKLVILSLEESPDLDTTTLEALEEFCSWLAARGEQFRVARLKELAREALLRAKLAHLPASALDYSSVDDAVRGEPVSPTRTP
jgi:sulfate permease, SulP family